MVTPQAFEDRAKLREFLEQRFSLEELKTLAFNLDIDYDQLPHETTSQLAKELIGYCKRRDILNDLIAEALRQRPDDNLAGSFSNGPVGQGLKVYPVFIASPSDVIAEREIVQQVIDQINEELSAAGIAAQLVVYRWEQVYPDVGLPQDVIRQQIPIEKCQIFIAILWRRFGRPPGSQRPGEDAMYLSGTQQEIDDALTARRKNHGGRPVIMIYRKLDPVPPEMSEEEFEQFQRVRQYLKNFEPDGANPALISPFESKQFHEILHRNLRQVVDRFWAADRQIEQIATQLQQVDRSVEIDGPVTGAFIITGDSAQVNVIRPEGGPPVSTIDETDLENAESDAFDLWSAEIGLVSNPFALKRADNEPDLARYFITPFGLHVPDLVDVRRPTIVFGRPGSGKTTLRKVVSAYCFPHKSSSTTLAIECGREELEAIIELADRQVQRVTPEIIAQHFLKMLMSRMEQLVAPRKLMLPDTLLQQYGGVKSGAQPLKFWLGNISALLNLNEASLGSVLNHVLYLVDQIDELYAVQQQPDAAEGLLTALLSLDLREARNLTLNYFLPDSMRLLLTGNSAHFRLDRCEITSIQWTSASLQKLIQQRLKAFSRNRLIGYSSLGELCEGGGDFARSIDKELVELASGSPRAALWLANQLFLVHCENDKPSRQIQSTSWERVKTRWYLDGRRCFFPDTSFWLYDDRLFYWEREIVLKARSRQLLTCLIRTEGRICDRLELAKVGWAEDQPEGVSKRAIDEAVRRMKIELSEQGIDSNWVRTVRSRGYRLASPTSKATPEDELEGIDDNENR